MLMERLVRPRALERFFFGTAIRSLYRVVEFATQGIERSPTFVASLHHTATLRRREIGAALRTQTRTLCAAQRSRRHRQKHCLTYRQGEVDLISDDGFGLAQGVAGRVTTRNDRRRYPARERLIDLGNDDTRDRP
jgi:glucose-6-phosphate-specific signal transduction histidine kinase